MLATLPERVKPTVTVVGHDGVKSGRHPGQHPRQRLSLVQAGQDDIDPHGATVARTER